MYRNRLQRIFELRDSLADNSSPNVYFQDYENLMATNSVALKHFLDIESDLTRLDTGAWNHLKKDVMPLFATRNPKRGWQAAFDKLNQAKAYGYLVDLDCTRVEFIPESSAKGRKTPDLQGWLGEKHVLCEVKTINISEDEANARSKPTARTIDTQLPHMFFEKLVNTLEVADQQMRCYDPDDNARRIAYLILNNFDDILHEYVEPYQAQLRVFVARVPIPGVEIFFDMKPAYYSAMP